MGFITRMKQPLDPKGTLVLLAGMLLALVLGSVHAFSVFLEPLESQFGATRSSVSLTYSLALACLTVGVLFGHRVYAHLSPPVLAAIICLVAAIGCAVAARADTLAVFWLGYSVLFGGANGLGYGFALQSAGQTNPKQKGLAMGLVTACYAIGAVIAPVMFELLLRAGGPAGAMLGMSAVLVVIAPMVAGMLHTAKAELKVGRPADGGGTGTPPEGGLTIRLWLGYGTAVAAGLMAIGHATGIARAGGLGDSLVLGAPITIAAFNVSGSFAGGWLADRIKIKHALTVFPACSAIALLMLARFDSGIVILFGLAVVGFAYGGSISVYPAAVAYLFGDEAGVRVYGRIFTAWGTAGLLAPWFAGFLFEGFGDYRAAMATAGGLGLVSVLVVRSMGDGPRTRSSHGPMRRNGSLTPPDTAPPGGA
jgi:MFS transporter, OFA family, oxalate/formate antiporter